jgi:hypothetical protein
MTRNNSNKFLSRKQHRTYGNKGNNIILLHAAAAANMAQVAASRAREAAKCPILLLFVSTKKMIFH